MTLKDCLIRLHNLTQWNEIKYSLCKIQAGDIGGVSLTATVFEPTQRITENVGEDLPIFLFEKS